jgi:tetratricopeptide (TPR) repeat protein
VASTATKLRKSEQKSGGKSEDKPDPTRPVDGGSLSPQKNAAIACLLLAVLTLAFYNPIAHCGFVYSDDVVYLTQNPAIQSGLTWEAVSFAFTSVNTGIWHPLTWLSHALDCQLFGLNPAGHHYVSLLFHTASAVLLFLLLLEATSAAWPSLIVALLFALHPENVESVAWAAERKNVLSMFFFLLTLWLYGKYAKSGGLGRYLGVVSLFALGLLAKPQIVTLPFVLLLWDYWPLRRMFSGMSKETSAADADSSAEYAPRSFWYLVQEKLPLFALAALSSAVTVWSQREGSALRSLGEYSLSVRLQNAIVSYVRYIAHTLWPFGLSPIYPHPGAPALAATLGAAALLAVLTIFVIRRRDLRFLAVGWFWFLGTLVPMIGIVQVGEQSMADRYAYIPTIGLFLLLAWGVAEIVQKKPFLKTGIAVATALAVVALGILTYRQLSYWHDGETLWGYAARVTDRNYLAHAELAMTLNGEGQFDQAIGEFRAAEALHQYPPDEVLKIGTYEQRNGHFAGAIEQYGNVVNSSATAQLRATAWEQTAVAYMQMRNYEQAGHSYDNALQLNPNDASALGATALLAERRGDYDAAAERLRRSLKIEPGDVGFLLLGDALRRSGRLQEAEAAHDMAQKISSNLDEAQKNAMQTRLFFVGDAN